MDNQKYIFNGIKEALVEADIEVFKLTRNWLENYFDGKNPEINLPLKINDGFSPFRKRVLKELINIPYGKTTTYGEIGKRIEEKYDCKVSNQAVGGAVGHNPISIIIPCHRVVGKNGTLTGYAGGVEKKARLLELEGVDLSELKW